jgi:LuxR family maltose regulon positive regulatory protein
MPLLDRLLSAADRGGRTGSVIEILVVQACAWAAQGDITRALGSLERALSLAEPEGYVRIFIDEGAPMANLLTVALTHGIMPAYTGRLLATFGSNDQPPVPAESQPSKDLLSRRELDVVRLISQGFSNKEISETLFLAIDTVKGHNRTIFRKLGSQNRTEAVARAREIGIL